MTRRHAIPSSNPVIDFHAHLLVEDVLEQTAAHNVMTGFGVRPSRPQPGTRMDGVFARMLDPASHLADMDAAGIDMEVLLSSTVIQGSSWAPPVVDLALNARVNDVIGEWVERHPDRFIGSCTVPLQDVSLALGELERAVRDLGASVVQVPARVGDHYLGAPVLRPFWEAVRDLGLVAFLHPEGTRDPWFQQYALWNSVGQPIEEAKALASMIYEGLLEEMPDIPIVVAHGGGFLPHYFGRMDRNVHNMPDSARNLSRDPGTYLGQLFYDTCVYDPAVLDALVDRFGADRLVLGSDHPVGETDPVGFLDRSARLTADDRALVAGATARGLLARGARDVAAHP